jgi:hypothetical protein
MNRLRHIEEQGYAVFHIWVSDFRHFSYDLEFNENVNIFDYMNLSKKEYYKPETLTLEQQTYSSNKRLSEPKKYIKPNDKKKHHHINSFNLGDE